MSETRPEVSSFIPLILGDFGDLMALRLGDADGPETEGIDGPAVTLPLNADEVGIDFGESASVVRTRNCTGTACRVSSRGAIGI